MHSRIPVSGIVGHSRAPSGGKNGSRNSGLRIDNWSQSSPQEVAGYYHAKTASILKKYGPGPRVHFHIGLFDGVDIDTTAPPDVIQRRIVASQEAMLARAAEVWNARDVLAGEVMDAGCGLGGGSIYWAAEYGARVTSVTIAAEHLPIIRRFAAEAGVADRVRTVLSDAAAAPAEGPLDAVVAMESACYFQRDLWFRHLAGIVRPGGHVCIQDVFLGRPEWRDPFDSYWKTTIAPVEEYVRAARAAGFVLDRNEDLTELTTEFWIQSIAWSESMLEDGGNPAAEQDRLLQSIRWHARFLRAWRDRGIEVRLLRFQKTG
jgi:tocopherol O-methyltransferase